MYVFVVMSLGVRVRARPHTHRPHRREHHQTFDILYPRVLDGFPEDEHPDGRPYKQQATKRSGNKPVKRRQVDRPAKDNVQRRCVDDEHPETRARDDPRKVQLVSNDVLAEREGELCFYRKYVEALDDEHGKIDDRLCLAESIDLLRSRNRLPPTIDEVWAGFKEERSILLRPPQVAWLEP